MLSDKRTKVLHSANYLFIFPVFPSYIAYQQAEIILLPRFAWNYNFICKIRGGKKVTGCISPDSAAHQNTWHGTFSWEIKKQRKKIYFLLVMMIKMCVWGEILKTFFFLLCAFLIHSIIYKWLSSILREYNYEGYFSISTTPILSTAASQTRNIRDNKNLASYVLDNKGNEDPRCNLFIILEYFFTKY